MNINFQTTAVIRQRGQLTIPEGIREVLAWIKKNAVAVIETTDDDGFIVKPYYAEKLNTYDKWGKAYEAVQLARSFKGKKGNLSRFVVRDRQSH